MTIQEYNQFVKDYNKILGNKNIKKKNKKMKKKNICKCKNNVTIAPTWSYFCLDCGRYTYDWDGNVQNHKKTIDLLQTYLEMKTKKHSEKRDLVKACIEIAKLKKKNMKKKTNKEPRFMFAIVSKDMAGETIQLFKTKKQAEMFLKELKK